MNTKAVEALAGRAGAPTGVAGSAVRAAAGVRAQLALLLLGHLLLWTWIGVSSRSNFDAPGDMVEAYVWSQGWQWGYFKHPPLSAWVAGLWFAVVPESHLGYSLLAALNGAVGLAGLAVLARQFMPGRWVLLCVALAALTPSVTTLAMRFNANAILVSSWPWAMALFVKLMNHHRRRDAAGLGVVCALALLGKYFSGVLLATLLAASVLVPAWRARWRTPGPWLAAAVFALLMAPHALWLAAQTHGPLQYAAAATVAEPAGERVMRAFTFALAQWVYPVLAFVVLAFALRGPARAAGWWQATTALVRPRWEAPWLLAVVPVVATVLGTLATGARTATVWGLPITAGLVLLAVWRAHGVGATVSLRRLWAALAVVWGLSAVLAPLWWEARARLATPGVAEPRQELAQSLDALWWAETGAPLRWVAGTRALAASTSFYTAGTARYWSLFSPAVETPWVDLDAMRDDGGLIVCAEADLECQRLAEAWSGEPRLLSVGKHERGWHFAPQRHVVFVVRPRAPVADEP